MGEGLFFDGRPIAAQWEEISGCEDTYILPVPSGWLYRADAVMYRAFVEEGPGDIRTDLGELPISVATAQVFVPKVVGGHNPDIPSWTEVCEGTSLLGVWGGWLYRTICELYTDDEEGNEIPLQISIALTFVPAPLGGLS